LSDLFWELIKIFKVFSIRDQLQRQEISIFLGVILHFNQSNFKKKSFFSISGAIIS